MPEPVFQLVECTSTVCGLRFSTDLSVGSISYCPKCGEKMIKIGMPYANYRNLNSTAKKPDQEIILILDNLRSSQNVGSIFRTSEGMGVTRIFCCGITPTPKQAGVRKSSLGAENLVQWDYHQNSKRIIESLAVQGKEILAFEWTQNSISLTSLPKAVFKNKALVLVLGNEVSGVDPEILSSAAHVVHIPMAGAKSSLNVAVAAGIILYTIRNLLE